MFKMSDFKLNLMSVVTAKIKARGWSQARAGREFNTTQFSINKVMHGVMGHCSTSRLIYMLYLMGYRVELKLTKVEVES